MSLREFKSFQHDTLDVLQESRQVPLHHTVPDLNQEKLKPPEEAFVDL